MTTLRQHALAVDVPAGWDVRIDVRQAEEDSTANPVLHAANFRLPADRGDFGSGAVDRMSSEHVFVSLFEFDPEASTAPLFAGNGFPSPAPRHFSTNQLQRVLPGQSGAQWFFTERGRAFCLYVVLGNHARRTALVPRVHELLRTLSIERRTR